MVVFHKQKMLSKWLFWKHFFYCGKTPFQKQFFISRVFCIFRKWHSRKYYFDLWKDHFESKNYNSESEVYFVSFRMIVLKALFLLMEKVFQKDHSVRVFISLWNACFEKRSGTQNRNTCFKKKS